MSISYVTQYVETGNFTGSGTPKTLSVTVGAGDLLIVVFSSSDYRQAPSTPSGGGLAYSQLFSLNVNSNANLDNLVIWSAKSPTAQTFSMSIGISPDNALDWGYLVRRYSGVAATGATATGQDPTRNNSLPSVNLTTTVPNAVVDMSVSDFWNTTGSRTYLTAAGSFTETFHTANTNFGRLDGGYYANAGSAGTYSVGQSAPTNVSWILAAVELVPADPPPSLVVNKALRRSTVY